MRNDTNIDTRRTVVGAARLPYEKIAQHILGPSYELSLTLCGDALAKRMNRTYRQKTYSPNVLSFPYSKDAGEIFLNIRKAEREAQKIGTSAAKRTALLLVHGCFHLKGYDHGATMEELERKALRKFDLF